MCFSAHGVTSLFAEADIDALVSSKIIVEYDVETNPRYGDDGKLSPQLTHDFYAKMSKIRKKS